MKSALAFVILILSSFSAFATVYHSDGSDANVQLIHDIQAMEGDTITLPAGTFSWTIGVHITKSITIQGQTTTNSDNGTANDQTVLVDNLINNGLINVSVPTSKPFRLTGITFTAGSRQQTLSNGMIGIGGQTDKVRLDHLHFTGAIKQGNYFAIYSTVYGVADHLVLDNFGPQLGQQRVWNGAGYGDAAFAQPADYGSGRFFFFEDCYINNTIGNFSASGGVDALRGGRYVVRHCHLFNVILLCHGTENDRSRGGRAQEIYDNDFHWSYRTTLDGIRSGSLIMHDNTFDGVLPDGIGMQTYRLMLDYGSGPWFGASGDSPWDVNVTEPDGTHVDGHPPYLFQSGTVTSATADPNAGFMTLTDTSKNWATNQWAYYTTHKVGARFIGQIISNTSNTLTMRCLGGSFHAGDQYQIHKVLIALDQPGRGQGDLISGDSPTPVAWPHQELEPCYSWNNIHSPGGEHINFNPAQSTADTVRNGRDYFNDTQMPGYAPYTYPHPLVTGGNPSPTPTAAPSPTPTVTATSTPTPTATPTATATFTPTPTPTATVPPSPTPIPSPTSTPTPTPVPGGTNVALAANGGVASASSTYNNNFPVTAVNDGNRLGLNWGNGGGWADGTPNVWPDWVEIDFNAIYPINEIDFFTVQDNYQNPGPPALDMTFTVWGVTDFDVQYWTGSTWTDIPGGYVTGNNHVWRQFTFADITTAKIRILINNSLAGSSRVTEIEAYRAGENPTPTPTPNATATPTPTPTPDQCEVPNFIGIRIRDAQSVWNDAGFTTEVITSENGGGHLIIWQSLPEGFISSCSDTTIIVE